MFPSPCVLLAAAAVVAATPDPRLNQDLSAQLTALVHDILQPYASASPGRTSSAAQKAADILKNEHLLGSARPAVPANNLVEQYAKPLALGTRAAKFAGDIADIHNDLVRGDVDGARQAIRELAKRAGRTEPDAVTLDKTVEQLRELEGGVEKPIEHTTIERPDHAVDITWDKPTGKVKIDVIDRNGPDGQPVRTTFTGETTAGADSTGKSLEVTGKPAQEPPRVTKADQQKDLRDKINGDWIDQNGKRWTLTGSGSALTAIEHNSSRDVAFQGKFELGKLTAEHVVSDPADISEPLPDEIKQGLAQNYRPPYRIVLNTSEDGDKLEGTWISLHVTYSGLTLEIKSVQDPYDTPLVLTRAQKTADSGTAPGMRDRDKP